MSGRVHVAKLRRPGLPGVAVCYDPSRGFVVEGEDVPAEPAQAAAWLRRSGGWLRFRRGAGEGLAAVAEFRRAWSKNST
ncbi:MAG: hypothetical protein PHS14_00435 [Elusimicrobia bacterium]|nr:hypothetical protein [Elusimicrobiota bacterium]